MQSIIQRLGYIAMLVTTVAAFELMANPAQQLDNETNNNQISSEQVSVESEAVITSIAPNMSYDSQGLSDTDTEQVNMLLNQLHESAVSADWATYFTLYHPDAIFIGTDATERWNMTQFKAFATPTKGWRYDLQSRHLLQIGDVVVFDEQLFSPAYGVSRGTGALINTENGWKIAQYHLSFPIPNAQAKRITTMIKQASQ